jgi:hypothetical protein
MGTQPKHEELFVALNVLCANAIANCEMELEDQRMSDRAEMWRLEEEERRREEAARLAAEKEKKEKLERSKKMEIDRQEIEAAERELEAKKEALRIAQKGPDDDDEEEDEEGGESNADERVVSQSFNILATSYTYFNECLCQETNKKKTKRELEEEARKKAPQTTHSSVSVPLIYNT